MDALTQALLSGTLGIGQHGVGEATAADDLYRSEYVRYVLSPEWGRHEATDPEDSWDAWMLLPMCLPRFVDQTPCGTIEVRRTEHGYVVSMNGSDVMLRSDTLRRAAIGSLNEMTAAFARGDIEAGAEAYRRVALQVWCDDHDAHVRAWEARTVPRGWYRRADGAIAPTGPRPERWFVSIGA